MSDTIKESQKYSLTDDHRAQLKPWADKWIANAMSTAPITADEKIDIAKYVKELYVAAKLPTPTYIFFAPSPFAMSVISGFGQAIAELGKKTTVTMNEMVDYVLKSADNSKNNFSKWYINPYNVKKLNEHFGFGEVGIECIKKSRNMWNGGNQWSGWVSHISFFRHVAKLDIDYTNWNCYEKLCELTGPRAMGADFCIISARPTTLMVNERNEPHNASGPFCKWEDGCALYSINGVRVPAFLIENPEAVTVSVIENEKNAEVRRCMIDIYGKDKFITDSKSEIVHVDDFGTLYRKKLEGDEDMLMVKVVNSTPEPDGTFKDYFIRVDPKLYGGIKTARAGVASTWRNKDGSLVFKSPEDYVLELQS